MPVTEALVSEIIENHLCTLKRRRPAVVEVAFYGGSFTGIPMAEQSGYLEIASFYKRSGLVDKIHISTRPDYMDHRILANLQSHGVNTIELGVQSFDDAVLEKANRGHNAAAARESGLMVSDYGFELGIQLMTGLPGDTAEKDVYSANELVKLKPSIARIYPTVVIEDTLLHDMYLTGEYTPPTLGESIDTVKAMYKIITVAGVNLIRIGLRSADLIKKAGAAFHPAFRQLVESELAKEAVSERIDEILTESPCLKRSGGSIRLTANERFFSCLIGHRKSNKLYFVEKYPFLKFSYETDNTLADNQYVVLK